jgi:GntR family transcriptional repressor for pyruvate dehydrogenase complex
MSWRSARSEPAGSRIERQIKAAILAGQFRAGDHLGSENELAASLGVSRLPVREAVGRLQALGLVEVKTGAGGGVRVAAGKPDHIAQMLVIQLVLDGLDAEQVLVAQRIVEVAAVGMAARSARAEDIDGMERALVEAARLCEHPDAFTAASMRFHAAVGEASGNRFLSIMMQAVSLALEQLTAPDTTVEVARRVVANHRKLLDAIKARDETTSVRLITRHLKRVHSHVLARLAKQAKPGSGPRISANSRAATSSASRRGRDSSAIDRGTKRC